MEGYECRHYWCSPFRDQAEYWYSPQLSSCVKCDINSDFLGSYSKNLAKHENTKPDSKLFDLKGYRQVSYKEFQEAHNY